MANNFLNHIITSANLRASTQKSSRGRDLIEHLIKYLENEFLMKFLSVNIFSPRWQFHYSTHQSLPQILINLNLQLGVVFLELNKPAQALAYLDKALEYDPEHEQALLNSAILLQELNKPELRKISKERLMKLLQKDGESNKLK